MAHFAKLDESNIVIEVLVVNNSDIDSLNEDYSGMEFFTNLSNGHTNWKQTSFNTYGGVHKLGGTPLRKNYAGIGYLYDPIRDAFIPPKPCQSWLLDEATCQWNAPTPYPEFDIENPKLYTWDEATTSWVEATPA